MKYILLSPFANALNRKKAVYKRQIMIIEQIMMLGIGSNMLLSLPKKQN